MSISQSVRLVILFLVWETRGGAEQSAEGDGITENQDFSWRNLNLSKPEGKIANDKCNYMNKKID